MSNPLIGLLILLINNKPHRHIHSMSVGFCNFALLTPALLTHIIKLQCFE